MLVQLCELLRACLGSNWVLSVIAATLYVG